MQQKCTDISAALKAVMSCAHTSVAMYVVFRMTMFPVNFVFTDDLEMS